MVEYLGKLFNTEEQLISLYRDFPEVSKNDPMRVVYDAFVKVVGDTNSIVSEKKFDELFYQITHITNYGTMEEVLGSIQKITEMREIKYEEFRPLGYSPFGIYYLWMEAYQYLPSNMKPAQ